ncbi:zinc-binding dehydrogenase [Flavobacterium sp. XS2P12]
MEEIKELLEAGKLKSHISQTFALKETYKAHQQIETHATKGKIVVKL